MSKKIAFLTIHVGENFGSNLQTIATAEVIKKTGNEPILILPTACRKKTLLA